MLREIGGVHQDSHRGLRRWFQDDYFDLYLWHDERGQPLAFQLCYDRHHAEGSIYWSAAEGYAHARVDAGQRPGGYAMTPILRSSAPPPYFRVYRRFLDTTRDWDPALGQFVLERLREYRFHLYGRRRPLRRLDRLRPDRFR